MQARAASQGGRGWLAHSATMGLGICRRKYNGTIALTISAQDIPGVASQGPGDIRFACDAMCGGLARWLWAIGYDATWSADIDDGELVQQADEQGRVLLSSDTGMFERRLITSGRVSALLLPRGLRRLEQLEYVVQRLKLPVRPPRCMALRRAAGADGARGGRRRGSRPQPYMGQEVLSLRQLRQGFLGRQPLEADSQSPRDGCPDDGCVTVSAAVFGPGGMVLPPVVWRQGHVPQATPWS